MVTRLFFSANFFLTTVNARPSVRQISSLLISKGKSRDSNFTRFDNYRQRSVDFFASSITQCILRQDEKDRQRLIAQGVRARHVCDLPAINLIGTFDCGSVEGHTANKGSR
jgi:hypothetical protein